MGGRPAKRRERNDGDCPQGEHVAGGGFVGSVFAIVLTMAFTLTTGFTPTFEAPFVLSPLFLVELVGRADLAELRRLGGFDEAKLLGTHEAAPEGRHYKGWT